MKKKRVYLDYNATTPLHPAVSKTILESAKIFGNPSSLHASGRDAKAAIEDARALIARFLGTEREHLVFTSSGSEANNQVIKSVLFESLLNKKPAHIITSAIEHSSIREAVKHVEKMGIEVTIIGCNSRGEVRLEDVRSAIVPYTRLISIQMANNEVGTLQPISDIAKLTKGTPILFHTDAVQAAGKTPIDVKALNVDFLTISAHKLYGPKGIGGLYVREDSTLHPLISGSSHERKLRAGTESVQSIIGFAKAVALLDNLSDYSDLRLRLISAVKTVSPDIVIHTPIDHSISNTLSLGFPGIDAHALTINLDLEGIEISTGSACSAGSIEPSPVLEAMGISTELNRGTIRVSLGAGSTDEDIYGFIAGLKKCLVRCKY